MYSDTMQRYLQRIQYNINKFNGTLLLIKGGSQTFEEVKPVIQNIRDDLENVYQEINKINPPSGLENVHHKVKQASKYYLQALEDFLKFYVDANDDHFVTGGLKINEANELLFEGADLLKFL